MAGFHDCKLRGGPAALVRFHFSVSISRRLAVATAVSLFFSVARAQSISPPRTEDPPVAPADAPSSSLVRPSSWNIDGVVNAIVQTGNTIYIGGEFSILDTHAGCGVPLDPSTSAISTSFPVVGGINSIVNAAADDGAGGWFIGGDFSDVGGLPRSSLAHVLADGTVTSWDPGAGAYEVRALAVEGDVVYVGGQFGTIGGQARYGLAAVDGKTGAVLPWNPALDGVVGALTISDHTLYVGGGFTSILGQSRSYIAAVDTRTGALTDWNPGAGDYVSCLAVHGNVVYAGGDFRTMGGVRRNFLAAVDACSGVTTAWDPNVILPPYEMFFGSDIVSTIAVTERAIYIGGYFSGIGGVERNSVGAVDPITGAVLPWYPSLGGFYIDFPFVLAIEASGPNVLVGGGFSGGGGGYTYPNFIVTDAVTGILRPWNTFADLGVAVIAPGRDHVFVGGAFKTFKERRLCLASIDATTRALTGWNSGFLGTRVNALAVRDSLLYVGGKFSQVAGHGGGGLAEVNTRTNMATNFLGSTDGEVRSLLVGGSRLYVGGSFTALYGLPLIFPAPARNGLGAFELDAGSKRGVVSTWDPQGDGEVDALALDDSTLFVGGSFGQMGGKFRSSIAALDTSTGLATSWNPSADGPVAALVVADSVVFAGGDFGSIGGASRRGLAALDALTGLATPWYPEVDGRVDALLQMPGALYVGGAYQNIGGQPRSCVAALTAQGGHVLPWDPGPNGEVRALAGLAWTVYAGGAFTSVSDTTRKGLVALRAAAARFALPTAPSSTGNRSALTLACAPSPAHSAVTIGFSIPSAGRVTLAFYDAAGRRVACPLERQLVAAGTRQVLVHTEAWPEGCYFCRLTVGATNLIRKLVVVR